MRFEVTNVTVGSQFLDHFSLSTLHIGIHSFGQDQFVEWKMMGKVGTRLKMTELLLSDPCSTGPDTTADSLCLQMPQNRQSFQI